LKKHIGYVAQDGVLFSYTIVNNISYGLDNVSKDDIIDAAKNANAHEFILQLPNKHQTKLEGTELSSLSGGQKQRISICLNITLKKSINIYFNIFCIYIKYYNFTDVICKAERHRNIG
jgi:ABC-type multidrug transport system fused ATPase/permease subunit